MVAPALMDQQQHRSPSALESIPVNNRHSLPVQRTRTKSMHLPSFSNTHPLVMAASSPSSPPSLSPSPRSSLESAKKRPHPPLVISMPQPSQTNNDLTRSTTASTASTPSVLNRVKRSFSRTIKSGRVADKPEASLTYESHAKPNPTSPSSLTSPVSSKRSSITSIPPLSPSSPTSSRASIMSIHHQQPHHPHYHHHVHRKSIILDPISEEQPLSEAKKSGKLKRWQSKSSAKLKKWLHIDTPSRTPSPDHDNNTTTPSTRRDSNATTCSSRVSHDDSHTSSIRSSPNTSMPPSPALSARSVLNSFSSRPTSLPPPALQDIVSPPPPVPRRRSLPARSEGRPLSSHGRILPRSTSLRASSVGRSPPGRIPPRSSSLPRSYRSSLKRRSLLGRTLSGEITVVPESQEEASFYAALAQVAAEVDEVIAAATESEPESESESTCSVRSRSSETLLLSECEESEHNTPKHESILRSLRRPSSSLEVVSPEPVSIPWSCSDVLFDRPVAMEVLEDMEAIEEVQALVAEQLEQYEQSTTIMSVDVVHGIDNSIQLDIDIPHKTECVDISLEHCSLPKPEVAIVEPAHVIEVSEAEPVVCHQEEEEDTTEEAPPNEVVFTLLRDDEEILDRAHVAILAQDEEGLLETPKQNDNIEEGRIDEHLDDNVDEDTMVLTRGMSIEEPEPLDVVLKEATIEVKEEENELAVTMFCESEPILPMHDIALAFDEAASFHSDAEVVDENLVSEETQQPMSEAADNMDQQVVVDEAFEEEDQVEEVVLAPPVETISDLVDDYVMDVKEEADEEVEAIVETTIEDSEVMKDPVEGREFSSVIPVEEPEIVSVPDEIAMEATQELVKEVAPMEIEASTIDILVEAEEKEEVKEVKSDEAFEAVDELAIIVAYEEPCQEVVSSMNPYKAASPMPSPELHPVDQDNLDIVPLVLTVVDIIPEPKVERSVMIQEDTHVHHAQEGPLSTKGIVWDALQELHPPAVSPWKRASRSPWLSASFWLHGQ
ncbi:hypothetical protein MVEG_01537 [Podila verticillata NRRL 6337]|nr:hypothetical protein MVEG_01537 [Podila verticillata NRRL 6337]